MRVHPTRAVVVIGGVVNSCLNIIVNILFLICRNILIAFFNVWNIFYCTEIFSIMSLATCTTWDSRLCESVYVCVCMCLLKPEGSLNCSSSKYVYLFFETEFFSGLEFSKQARPAGPWVPGIKPSLPVTLPLVLSVCHHDTMPALFYRYDGYQT